MKSLIIGIALGGTMLASSASAEGTNANTRAVTLAECIELALKDNLDIRIEKISPQLFDADLQTAKAAYDPNFSISTGHDYNRRGAGPSGNRDNTDSINAGVDGRTPFGGTYTFDGGVNEKYGYGGIPFGGYVNSGGSAGLTLSQPLLKNFLIDQTRFNIQIARLNLKNSEWQYRLQIMSVLSSVEQAYYDLIFARENVLVQQSGLELAQLLFEQNKLRVRVGTMAPLDEKQAESQMAARQSDLTSARRSLQTAQNTLKRLLSSNYRDVHEVSYDPSEPLGAVPTNLDVQDSWRKGLSMRPELLQTRLTLERAGITLKYNKNQLLPQLDVNGSYGYNASGVKGYGDAFDDLSTANKPFYGIGAKFSIPVGNAAAKSRYRSSKLNVEQATLGLKLQEEQVLVQIDEAVNTVRSNFEKVQSTRRAREYAELALKAENDKLNAGRSTSFVVLQLQRDLTSARSEEIRALAEYNKSLAEIAFQEGATFERHKISVLVK